MKRQQELYNLYGTWRSLTQTEGTAILTGDWVMVTECQNRKRLLQDEIAAAECRWEDDIAHGEQAVASAQSAGPKAPLRDLIQELLLLEKENLAAVAEKRRTIDAERKELNRCARNLKQIHSAYAFGPGARWHSYS